MTKAELLALLKDVEDDNSEVDEILKGTDFAKSMLNIDNFKSLISTDKDFRSFMDSERDKYHAKALDTWKSNHLQKLVDEKVKELYPEKDEKDIELQKLNQKIAEMEARANREKLRNIALKTASEKKLPSDLIDYFIGQDEESTLSNLEKLEKTLSTHVEGRVKETLKDESYQPPKGGGSTKSSYEDLVKNADKMTAEEIAEQFKDLE